MITVTNIPTKYTDEMKASILVAAVNMHKLLDHTFDKYYEATTINKFKHNNHWRNKLSMQNLIDLGTSLYIYMVVLTLYSGPIH